MEWKDRLESSRHKSKNSSVFECLHDFLMKCCCLVLHAYGPFMYNAPLNWYWRWKHLCNFWLAACIAQVWRDAFSVSQLMQTLKHISQIWRKMKAFRKVFSLRQELIERSDLMDCENAFISRYKYLEIIFQLRPK